jgi:hypothetical protein
VRVAATAASAGGVADPHVTEVLLGAYQSAVASAPASCHLPVSLLAAIGQVESGSLAGRHLDAKHRTRVFGPVLDGRGVSAVADTDDGRVDGDRTWDRAVGPMQFLPATWRTFGVDGDGDGVADPQDVEDAAASTAAYLCYGGRDLSDGSTLGAALLSYNHSTAYRDLVLTYQRRYARLGLDDGSTVTGVSSSPQLTAEALQAFSSSTATAIASAESSAGHASGRTRARSTTSAGSHHHAAARATASPSPASTRHTPTASAGATGHPTATATATASSTATGTGTTATPSSPSPSDPATGCPVSPTATPTPSAGPTPGTPTATCPPCGTAVDPSATPTPSPAPTGSAADPSATCQSTPLTTASPSSAP